MPFQHDSSAAAFVARHLFANWTVVEVLYLETILDSAQASSLEAVEAAMHYSKSAVVMR